MICPSCGSLPDESAAYCTACGARLLVTRESAELRGGEPTTPLTLVAAMVGSERVAWIDSVWGRTAVGR